MAEKEHVTASFYSDTGQTALTLLGFRRDGNDLVMSGKLMGAWESDIIIRREELIKAMKIMMNPTVIGYVLSVPFMKKNATS